MDEGGGGGRKMKDSMRHNSNVVKGLLALLVVFGAIMIILQSVQMSTTVGHENIAACNDFNPCTSNHVLSDNTCVTPPQRRPNGYDCSSEDHCYLQPIKPSDPAYAHAQNQPIKQCQDGQCIASRHRCNGYCYNDTHCNTWRLPLRLAAMNGTAMNETFCFAQSCITLVIGGYTGECLSWLDLKNTHHNNRNQYIAKCLYMRFDDYGGNFPPGVCFYRYLCAPFDFRPPYVPASLSSLNAGARHYERRADEQTVTPNLGALRMNFGPEPLSPLQYAAIGQRISSLVQRYQQANPTN